MRRKQVKTLIIGFMACALLSGCGYQYGQEESILGQNATLTVPYVEGDQEGALTAAIIKELTKYGQFEYRYSSARFVLKVAVLDIEEDNIGFRYDRKKRGALTKDIIPTEERIIMTTEVSIVEACSDKTVLGPVRLAASVDYDHDYYFSRDGVNIFSLGQLTDLDTAYDAVQAPLNQAMAEKIIDYITQSW
jgi:hypothetical protein